MKKRFCRLLMLITVLAMLLQIPALAAAGFPDVPDGAWYQRELEMAVNADVIHGDTNGTFRPDDYLTYGEFYTAAVNCLNVQYGNKYTVRSTTGHWALPYYELLREIGALRSIDAGDSNEELDKPIDRYEATLIIYNCLFQIGSEKRNTIAEPEKLFADYGSMPVKYRFAVTQLYGKGIINGYPDGFFHGDNKILRSEVAALVCRFLWSDVRLSVDPSVYYTPAAIRWRQLGWMNEWGSVSPELCTLLTGHSDRPYFYSWDEAAPYMTEIEVPVWHVDGNGVKYTAFAKLTVNTAVEKDVRAIFEIIYNDPERFPITDVGCARFSDTMRHAWGCAIDINPYYNAECRAYYDWDMNMVNATQTSGFAGWWPAGTEWTPLAGSLPYPSIYSIPRGGSVENAFREYGWGWGGNGWSVQQTGSGYSQGFDLMHFSVLPSGG